MASPPIRAFDTTLDAALCNGCTLCVTACPADIFTMVGDKARATAHTDRCIHCDHCAAICPTGAVTVNSVSQDAVALSTVANASSASNGPKSPDTPDAPSVAGLVRLMRARRSCRMYRDKPVDRAVLEDLVRIGITAPSGTNSQVWTFTILPTRQAMQRLGELAARFFRQLNFLARLPPARLASRIFSGDALGQYYRENYERVTEALDDWDRTGRDLLFHGAPAAILIGGTPGGTTPREDALLAAQNILLAAQAMGLGTCLIGFAVEALAHDPRIKHDMGIASDERIYAVIALGHPKAPWKRPTGRRPVTPRYWEG
jgi:nitroreductase/NAD-dependent dihydropyrimidine dehydrogenase PreA subunit